MRISRNVAILLAGMVVLALVAALAFRALRPVPTDEERIQGLLDAAARAVEERRPADVVDLALDEADARYAGSLIAVWALRYLGRRD